MSASGENLIRREKLGLQNEFRIIPGWAIALAVVIFVGLPICFWLVIWPNSEDVPPSRPFRILLPFIVSTILAFYALLIGYVNRDAGRRGMSRTLWTLLVIFIPNAIGFIIYFLLRNPIQMNCPKCGLIVDQRANYCPNCRYSFHPTCAQCKAPVRTADAFCAQCGAQVNA
jgi:hypothetical protein